MAALPLKLVVFDLDGTLTRTNAEDDRAFVDAARHAFGIQDVDTDWSRYVNQTDRGLMEEVFAARHGRAPTAEEAAAFRRRFLANLAAAIEPVAGRKLATPGAHELLARLRREGWGAAIATGCWPESARLKLTAADLPLHLPMATADDALTRAEILRAAIGRSQRAGTEPGGVVYVGDRPWDGRAAAALGAGFVAVAGATPPDILRVAGAAAVLSDLTPESALPALELAARR